MPGVEIVNVPADATVAELATAVVRQLDIGAMPLQVTLQMQGSMQTLNGTQRLVDVLDVAVMAQNPLVVNVAELPEQVASHFSTYDLHSAARSPVTHA